MPYDILPQTGGQLNTQLFKKVYIVSSITMAFFTLPAWLSSVAFSVVIMVVGDGDDDNDFIYRDPINIILSTISRL